MANGPGKDEALNTGNNPAASARTAGAASSSGTSGTSGEQTPPKTFGHGSKESDVGYVNGAFAMAERADRERSAAGNVRVVRRDEGGTETIVGETIPEMRARVAREREESGPTDFQRSILGRAPGQVAPGAGFADTSIGTRNEGTATGGTGLATGSSAGAAGAGAGAGVGAGAMGGTAIPGTGGTGTAAR